jgi:hypothetical protein
MTAKETPPMTDEGLHQPWATGTNRGHIEKMCKFAILHIDTRQLADGLHETGQLCVITWHRHGHRSDRPALWWPHAALFCWPNLGGVVGVGAWCGPIPGPAPHQHRRKYLPWRHGHLLAELEHDETPAWYVHLRGSADWPDPARAEGITR